MRALIDGDQTITVMLGEGEFEKLKQDLADGQYLIFSGIPIEGVQKLVLFGTNPEEARDGNLRCMVCSHKGSTVDIKLLKEFMSQIGRLFGYEGTEDFGLYKNLTDAQIRDAMTGHGEFPMRGGIGPEIES